MTETCRTTRIQSCGAGPHGLGRSSNSVSLTTVQVLQGHHEVICWGQCQQHIMHLTVIPVWSHRCRGLCGQLGQQPLLRSHCRSEHRCRAWLHLHSAQLRAAGLGCCLLVPAQAKALFSSSAWSSSSCSELRMKPNAAYFPCRILHMHGTEQLISKWIDTFCLILISELQR